MEKNFIKFPDILAETPPPVTGLEPLTVRRQDESEHTPCHSNVIKKKQRNIILIAVHERIRCVEPKRSGHASNNRSICLKPAKCMSFFTPLKTFVYYQQPNRVKEARGVPNTYIYIHK